jgi:hypothetical protein
METCKLSHDAFKDNNVGSFYVQYMKGDSETDVCCLVFEISSSYDTNYVRALSSLPNHLLHVAFLLGSLFNLKMEVIISSEKLVI